METLIFVFIAVAFGFILLSVIVKTVIGIVTGLLKMVVPVAFVVVLGLVLFTSHQSVATEDDSTHTEQAEVPPYAEDQFSEADESPFVAEDHLQHVGTSTELQPEASHLQEITLSQKDLLRIVKKYGASAQVFNKDGELLIRIPKIY